MKTLPITLVVTCTLTAASFAQSNINQLSQQKGTSPKVVPSKVDFRGFQLMTTEVAKYRQSRMVTLDKFNEMSADAHTIILDTRSAKAFKGLHIKGAAHLNFSDFTKEKLAKVIPNKNTRILIYCNNNIFDDKRNFPCKGVELALNIPTFINLYGYGYKNIYELSEGLSITDKRLKLEGDNLQAIKKHKKN